MEISKKEQKILTTLFEDARESYTQIGKICLISKESAANTISNLQKKGIIQGFSSILDTHTLGKKMFRLMFSGNLTYDVEQLDEIGDIAWVAELAGGKWDLTVAYYCKSANEFYELLEKIFKYIHGITAYDIIQVLGVEFYFPEFIGKTSTSYRTGKTKNIFMSENETKVTHHLIKDARESILDIAKNVNLSPTATTYIVKKLFKEEVLIGSIPNINYAQLGYDHYKIFLHLKDPSQRSQTKELLKKHPGLIFITNVLANHSIECEVVAPNLRNVTEFISNLQKTIDITEYEVILTSKVIMHSEGL